MSRPRITFNDMQWFKPCVKFAKVREWDTDCDAYGAAAAYGCVFSVVPSGARVPVTHQDGRVRL